jgi:biotin carboxylase
MTSMRVLISDASSLAARQAATILARGGHEVEALGRSWLSLCRHTKHVRRLHEAPVFGRDPFGWLTTAARICGERDVDVLFPTQEQAALLAAFPERVRESGAALAVPPFASLERVQDKVSAAATLRDLALPQPAFTVARSEAELLAAPYLPAFAKAAVGTASVAVRHVTSEAELRAAAGAFAAEEAVVVQQSAEGPLAMVQAVFARGELVAHHVNLRLREGARGGASHKESLRRPDIEAHLRRFGSELAWHGALSLDCILTRDGPSYIDVNPRLVEPMNAWLSGADLVATLLDVALDRPPARLAPGRAGVRSHQTLLALLGAARRAGTRRAVAIELLRALAHRGLYRGSAEELTPTHGDPRAAVPVAAMALALAVRPASWAGFATGATDAYALTPAAWREIVARVTPARES